MITETRESGWAVEPLHGFSISHTLMARAPKCAGLGRHPMRTCGCKTFRFRKEAVAYIETKEREASAA